MKNFKRSLKNLKKISLTENEKSWSKEGLIHFMEKHPVRDEEQARHQLQKARTAFVPLQLIYSIKPMTALVVIALIFSLGGGTSLAANDALPGDALYPVKIHVNEKFEGVFALSEEAEADFNLEKAEVRLQETEELASKNKADSKALSKVEARFDKHIQKAEKLATKFETKGKEAKAAEIKARLEAMLEVHSQILALLQAQIDDAEFSSDTEVEIEIESENEDGDEFGKFVTKIKIKSESLSDDEDEDDEEDKEESKGEISMQAALNAQKLAKKHLERITGFAKKKSGKLEAGLSLDIESYLQDAEVLIAEGDAQLEAGDYAGAFATFHQAHKHIQKANSYIATGGKVDLSFGTDDDDEEENEEKDEDEDDEDEKDEDEDELELKLESNTQLNVFSTEVGVKTRTWSRF